MQTCQARRGRQAWDVPQQSDGARHRISGLRNMHYGLLQEGVLQDVKWIHVCDVISAILG